MAAMKASACGDAEEDVRHGLRKLDEDVLVGVAVAGC
jgi:hypothetical protein